jgi:hypothetical protein
MKKQLLLLIMSICVLTSCGDKNNGVDGGGGDWYNGGISGGYETFTIEINTTEDWEASAIRLNSMIDDWFTFSPTKGKAGTNKVTFRVSSQTNIADWASFEINRINRSGNREEDMMVAIDISMISPVIEFFGYEAITKIDISDLTRFDEYRFYFPNGLPNLKEVTMRRGQNIYQAHSGTPANIEELPWEIIYK